MMRNTNETIFLSKKDVEYLLREVEFVLVSLVRLNNFYKEKLGQAFSIHDEYCEAVTEFIDAERVNDRLAKMRMVIASKFDDTLGDDDMDDLERVLDKIEFWERPKNV